MAMHRFMLYKQRPFSSSILPSTRKRRLAFSCDQRRSFSNTPFLWLSSLPPPTILYSDNHLLAVNKPAGWHSVPNLPKKGKRKINDADETDSSYSKKCLLTHLQQRQLGGGSKQNFLIPLHRIDQPCTGVLLFGKTSKAASRVTKVWKGKKRKNSNPQKGVTKDYLCVVSTSQIATLGKASLEDDSGQWNRLDGLMLRQSASQQQLQQPSYRQLQRREQQRYYKDRLRKGRSVQIVPVGDGFYEYDHEIDNATMRPVHVLWKIVEDGPNYTLLLVRTSEGARHMVRALLAQIGCCPIVGDVRYGQNKNNDSNSALPDRSVALHAYGVYFDPNQLQLGSLDTFEFRAPVPLTWESFFGIDNDRVKNLLEEAKHIQRKGDVES